MLMNLDTHDGPCRTLCNKTWVIIVSVEYRKAPQFKAPVPAEDCYAALDQFRWATSGVSAEISVAQSTPDATVPASGAFMTGGGVNEA